MLPISRLRTAFALTYGWSVNMIFKPTSLKLSLALLFLASCAKFQHSKTGSQLTQGAQILQDSPNTSHIESTTTVSDSSSSRSSSALDETAKSESGSVYLNDEKQVTRSMQVATHSSPLPEPAPTSAPIPELQFEYKDPMESLSDESSNKFGINLDRGNEIRLKIEKPPTTTYLKDDVFSKSELKNSVPTSFGVHYSRSSIVEKLNRSSLVAVRAPWSETRPFFCSRFVRQVFQYTFKSHAKYIDDKLFGYSAYDTERLWRKAGQLFSLDAIEKSGGLVEGDVVFQNYPVWGHVGIVVKKNGTFLIAENTVRYGFKVRDHRALTPLSKFGKIRSVGRLKSI